MNSYPGAAEVTRDLGDKVMEGFSCAVSATRDDLAEYRELRPDWVAQHSERGLANWLHDRLWQHLITQLDHHDEVNFGRDEVKREFTVGVNYRFRAKRHDEHGAVRTFSTQTALDFMLQAPVQLPLDEFEEVRLIVGYEWDSASRNVGPGVLSLRNGQHVVWHIELPSPPQAYGDSSGDRSLPPTTDVGPARPTIEVDDATAKDSGAGSA
ncbi:hypothetical protein ABT332_11265 [Saccharomonospora azurea]|uniref:hypothetical protein n=1 Tax=Saccharomonospora azurea TaxID=40988 RepID=UPI00332FF5B4